MGIFAPIVFYQVSASTATGTERNLEELKTLGKHLSGFTLTPSNQDRLSDPGGPLVRQEPNGMIRIFRETQELERPVLVNLLMEYARKGFAVVVPDLDRFFDCDLELLAIVLALTKHHEFQILAARLKEKKENGDRCDLIDALKINPTEEDANEKLRDLIYANSGIVHKRAECLLDKKFTNEDEIEDLSRISRLDSKQELRVRLVDYKARLRQSQLKDWPAFARARQTK